MEPQLHLVWTQVGDDMHRIDFSYYISSIIEAGNVFLLAHSILKLRMLLANHILNLKKLNQDPPLKNRVLEHTNPSQSSIRDSQLNLCW